MSNAIFLKQNKH